MTEEEKDRVVRRYIQKIQTEINNLLHSETDNEYFAKALDNYCLDNYQCDFEFIRDEYMRNSELWFLSFWKLFCFRLLSDIQKIKPYINHITSIRNDYMEKEARVKALIDSVFLNHEFWILTNKFITILYTISEEAILDEIQHAEYVNNLIENCHYIIKLCDSAAELRGYRWVMKGRNQEESCFMPNNNMNNKLPGDLDDK